MATETMLATNLYAPEAERTIVGAVLKKNALMPEVAASLRPQTSAVHASVELTAA